MQNQKQSEFQKEAEVECTFSDHNGLENVQSKIYLTDSIVEAIYPWEDKLKFEPVFQHCIHDHRRYHTIKYKIQQPEINT